MNINEALKKAAYKPEGCEALRIWPVPDSPVTGRRPRMIGYGYMPGLGGPTPVFNTLACSSDTNKELDDAALYTAALLAHAYNHLPKVLEALQEALTHVQLLGSGQPPVHSNAEMCSIVGDALDDASEVKGI